MSTLLEQTKVALRTKTEDTGIDEELRMLIISAIADLKETAGVDVGDISPCSEINHCSLQDALLVTAIKTYVRIHFGQPDDYDNLVRSYDMQKKQLLTRYYLED